MILSTYILFKKYFIPIVVYFDMILGIVTIKAQELSWKHTGGPMGGIVGDLGIDSKGNIYAGTYPLFQNGLYKSTDNGESWNELNLPFEIFDLYSISVYSIYITKSDHIWVGTDQQLGPYLSTDYGQTWQNKSNGYGTSECWAIGQSLDSVLFAGDGQYNQLYYSTNYGDSWKFSANLSPLVFATDSNNIVYAGTFTGLYSSTDNGLSWIPNNRFVNIPIASILIDENNNLYCGTGYYNNGNGLFYSSDGGKNWEQLGLTEKVVLSLAFDSDGNLFAGTQEDGLFVSDDLGESWYQLNDGLYRKDIFRLKINKKGNIFIGSEGGSNAGPGGGGVFRSTNGGISFEHIGLPISRVNNFVFSGDSVIITATPSGVQRFNRITRRWKNIGLYIVESVAITPSNILYAATRDEGLYKSTDLGESWSLTNLTKDSMMSVYNLQAINDDTLFAATPPYSLMRTTDGGTSWDGLSIKGGPGLFFKNSTLWAIGYVSHEEVLFKSTDFGETFGSVYTSFGTSSTNSTNPIAATENGYVFLASHDTELNGIVRSSDNGSTWEKVLSLDNIRPSVYADKSGLVITGTVILNNSDTNKIYLSTNFGDSWSTFVQPTKFGINITDIEQDSSNTFFFGTSSGGLYEVDIITDVRTHPTKKYDFYLSQNYPNPFNPTTTIEYSVPFPNIVQLKLYNMLGQQIKIILNEYKQAGYYKINFDASNLSSGIYFYKLTVGERSKTKKMLVVK